MTNPTSKGMDIENELIDFLRANCGCDFTADRLTDRFFICSSDLPQSVIYEARLHGTLQANASRLLTILEEWISSDTRSISVQFLLLGIERLCIVSSSTQSLCGVTTVSIHESGVTTTGTGEGSSNLGAMIGGVLSILITLTVISVILVVYFMIQRRRKLILKSNKERK